MSLIKVVFKALLQQYHPWLYCIYIFGSLKSFQMTKRWKIRGNCVLLENTLNQESILVLSFISCALYTYTESSLFTSQIGMP